MKMTEPSASVGETVDRARGAAAELGAQDLATRSNLLIGLADALDADDAALVTLAMGETGLTAERLHGELRRTTDQLRLFATVVTEGAWLEASIDHADPAASPPRPDIRRMLVPLGPVAVYSASNFPFAFSVGGGDTASGLAAGCPVVVKGHSGHPELSSRTAELLASAVRACGAPEGTIGLVQGRQAGRDLIVHPHVRAGAFTGSLHAGRLLYDLANARPDPIPFYGELGSINPVVIGLGRDRAAAEQIATGLISSFTLGQGQFCTKPGIVFVPAGSQLPELIASALNASGGRMLTTSIAGSFDDTVAALSTLSGVRVVAQGVLTIEAGHGAVPANPPTVFATDATVAREYAATLFEECFGPATVLVCYDDVAELESVVDMLPGALTATVHADDEDLRALASVVDTLRGKVGRLLFGGWPTGVTVGWSTQHGGPWPATTNSMFTSVGTTAMRRFLRPIAYQDAPQEVLPPPIRSDNPWDVPQRVDATLNQPGQTTA